MEKKEFRGEAAVSGGGAEREWWQKVRNAKAFDKFLIDE